MDNRPRDRQIVAPLKKGNGFLIVIVVRAKIVPQSISIAAQVFVEFLIEEPGQTRYRHFNEDGNYYYLTINIYIIGRTTGRTVRT